MNILILSPHTDDGECGCGGSIAKYTENNNVYYASFSFARESIPDNFHKNSTQIEMLNAVNTLGISNEHIFNFDYKVRNFPAFRQEILEDMIKLNKLCNPDLVFLPSTYDTHQDHNVICNEGFRAFKKTSILGYEIIWNNLDFKATTYIILTPEHVEKKISALSCYNSQKIRFPDGAEFMKTIARVRGSQIRTEYAECFETIRWIIK
jgi:N-acetylglucosamine malate deacetylase 1